MKICEENITNFIYRSKPIESLPHTDFFLVRRDNYLVKKTLDGLKNKGKKL